MKSVFKKIYYGLSSFFSGAIGHSLARWFIQIGYMFKSEHYYYKGGAKELKMDRADLHPWLASNYLNSNEEIHFFEFGVLWGHITRLWLSNNTNKQSLFWGFDTFTGLPEDWGSVKKGEFSAKGNIPQLNDDRVKFIEGLIQNTLPPFLKSYSGNAKKVIHIDVDLYNASLFTLIQMAPLLKKGDVILFDDFFTITKPTHEFKAWMDFLSLYPLKYKPVYKCRQGHYGVEIL
jgi:O-methyltransferase